MCYIFIRDCFYFMSASNSKVSTRVCLYLFSKNSERNIQKNKHNKTHRLRTHHHMWPWSEYIICDPLHRRWVEVSLCSANGFSMCLVQLCNTKYIEVSNLRILNVQEKPSKLATGSFLKIRGGSECFKLPSSPLEIFMRLITEQLQINVIYLVQKVLSRLLIFFSPHLRYYKIDI